MERHGKNALAVARYLESHDKVDTVNYPGLRSHPQHTLAKKQMDGFSGTISFEIKGRKNCGAQVSPCAKIFAPAESLGGVESLIEHPATMTHASVPKKERR